MMLFVLRYLQLDKPKEFTYSTGYSCHGNEMFINEK